MEPDAAALARRTAQYFVEMVGEAVAGSGRARIAISGGSTPKAAFQLLADPGQPWRSRMPWDKLELYWVDERCVPPDHPDSNYRMTREALLDHVPLRPEQIHRMEGELEPEVAAARYESMLREHVSPGGRRDPALRPGRPGHGAGRPHRFALSAHRGHSRDEPAGDGQPRAAEGYLAHHADLAGNQPRELGILPDRRGGQG